MPDPTLTDLAELTDAVTDLARVVARQGATLDRLADGARAAEARDRAGADVALLVDLLALHRDAAVCADTARSARERAAFTALAANLDRLLAGRGGSLVAPAPGTPFDPATMDAAQIVPAADPAHDRTVDAVVEAGLLLTASRRCVRPARVVVRRAAAEPGSPEG